MKRDTRINFQNLLPLSSVACEGGIGEVAERSEDGGVAPLDSRWSPVRQPPDGPWSLRNQQSKLSPPQAAAAQDAGIGEVPKRSEGGGVRFDSRPKSKIKNQKSKISPSFLLSAILFLSSCSQNPENEPASQQPPEPTRQVTTATRPGQQTLQSRNPDGTRQFAPKPGSIYQALSTAAELNFRERIHIIQDHYHKPETLSASEIKLLFDFVRDQGDDLKLRSNALYALKNDILNLLTLRLEDHAPIITLLQEIQADTQADPIMRNYATQFLASLDMSNDAVRAGHWNVIQTVTSGGEGKVSREDAHNGATALLHLLPVENPGMLGKSERRRLEKSALQIASRDDLPDSARLTALQVCGQLSVHKAADLAYELSQSSEASIPLRIAAIATIGNLDSNGEATDLLHKLMLSENQYLRKPAYLALKKIHSKSEKPHL